MAELRVDNASVRYGTQTVLSDVSFTVAPGELVAVLGASGCGKTTLLRVIAGLADLSAGRISLGDHELSTPNRRVAPRDRRIGLVFQDYALFPDLTVRANVGFSPAAEASEVERLIALVGLKGLEQRYPRQLSGGQQQRVALARALAAHPAMLLLDEPFANLDPHLRGSLGGELKNLLRAEGCGAVLVTHDRTDALALADRVIVMLPSPNGGVVGGIGTPVELWSAPVSEAVASVVVDGCPLDVEDGRTVFGGMPGVPSGRVWVRPDQAALVDGEPNATVRSCRFVGPHWRVQVTAAGVDLWVDTMRAVVVDDAVRVALQGGCHVGETGGVVGR